jgi:hypothetical protein
MKRIFVKYLSISLIVLTTQSCKLFFERTPEGWPAFEIRPLVGVEGFPPATSVYGKAFRDGCGSAWDAVTRGLVADVNPKGMDPVKASTDQDYRVGWWDGFEQCTYIADWDVV